jgi:sugar phosphate isomerase/epimerase
MSKGSQTLSGASPTRREFLYRTAAVAAVAVPFASAAPGGMKMCLNTGNIGVKATLAESIALAAKYGFQAVDPRSADLTALPDAALQQLLDDMKAKNIEFGAIFQGVPVAQADDRFAAFIKDLDTTCKTLQRASVTRFTTWINSSDNRMTYLQNFRQHTRRIAETASVLGDHGIRFGLEYVAPKTTWSAGKYPFIHNIETMRELITEVKKNNVGFLIDSWHWYTAHETPADLLALRKDDVVAVHLNDAPTGIAVDQQIDSVRALPAATGVIDTSGFLNALHQIGYEGPVTAEPFDAALRKLPAEESLARTAQALQKAFALIK